MAPVSVLASPGPACAERVAVQRGFGAERVAPPGYRSYQGVRNSERAMPITQLAAAQANTASIQ